MDLDFEAVLDEEKLVTLICSPLFRAIVDALPVRGELGRPAEVTPAVAVMMGAATAIAGRSKLANRLVYVRWNALRRVLIAEGHEVPLNAPNRDHWYSYRDTYLPDETALMPLLDAHRATSVSMAQDMGLCTPVSYPVDYLEALPGGTYFADGSWFRPASEIGYNPLSESRRGKDGTERILPDVVQQSDRGLGYPLVSLGVRAAGARRRMILDFGIVDRGNPAAEVDYAIGLLRRSHPLLEGLGAFWVYDGAMDGVHHRQIREEFGLLTVSKVVMRKTPREWVSQSWHAPVVRKDVWQMNLDQCTHWLGIEYGALWEVEKAQPRFEKTEISPSQLFGRYERPLRVVDVRRSQTVLGGYRWEMDVRIQCAYGPHIIPIDPNGWAIPHARKLLAWSGKSGILDAPQPRTAPPSEKHPDLNIAHQLRVIDQTRTHRFSKVYGSRNDAESWNNTFKNIDGYGSRAKGYTRSRFLLDVLFLTMVRNTLAWMEHKEKPPVARRAS